MSVAQREGADGTGSHLADQRPELCVEPGDLARQCLHARCDAAQCQLRGLDRVAESPGISTQAQAGGDQPNGGAVVLETGAQRLRGCHEQGLQAVHSCGLCLDGAAAGDAQRPDRLDASVSRLRCDLCGAGEDGPRSGLGVDLVGLPNVAAESPFGPRHFDDRDVLRMKVTGQACAVRAAALDANTDHSPVFAHPAQQLAVPSSAGRELSDTQQPAAGVQRRSTVHRRVRVDTAITSSSMTTPSLRCAPRLRWTGQ